MTCRAKKLNRKARERNKNTQRKQAAQVKRIRKDNLVEFSVDSHWVKLFKKALELQRINGDNLRASSLPPISETNQNNGFAPFYTQKKQQYFLVAASTSEIGSCTK